MAQIGQPDGVGTSPDFELLEVALRTRAESAGALAELVMLDEDTVQQQLTSLAEQGYLRFEGRRINYVEPDAVLAEHASALLDEAQRGLRDRVADVTGLLTAIPRLMQSWELGGSEHLDLKVDVLHGPFAATELWLALARRQPPPLTCGSLPDALRLFQADPALRRRWLDLVERENLQVRGILSAADVAHPGTESVIVEEHGTGFEFRMLANPPGWFWCAGDVAALPLSWGDGWPTSTVAIRSPAVAGLVRWVFDRLWESALPVPYREPAWEGLLRLMAQGATLDAASHALGISSRTGRRRIDDAMNHYGVSGQLALGAAWERERSLRV